MTQHLAQHMLAALHDSAPAIPVGMRMKLGTSYHGTGLSRKYKDECMDVIYVETAFVNVLLQTAAIIATDTRNQLIRLRAGESDLNQKKSIGDLLKICEQIDDKLFEKRMDSVNLATDAKLGDEDLQDDAWFLCQIVNYWSDMDTFERMSLLRHAKEIGHTRLSETTMERIRPKKLKDAQYGESKNM